MCLLEVSECTRILHTSTIYVLSRSRYQSHTIKSEEDTFEDRGVSGASGKGNTEIEKSVQNVTNCMCCNLGKLSTISR